ncbi:MAG TPA: tRNA uridine-5-carboxymethylaminomethyl(34) synthesis GTPase MnmE [Paracoccaceae bacterium]|nr:tRNA uridine-5-carboxymethylaminomethyl(34) synthesis GTPase MnmE [Paracoccaceae bacterium]
MDTIFALATAAGKAGVAIIRISGPEAFAAAGALCGAVPTDGRALRKLRGQDGSVIDEALVLGFGKGHSFTGEDVVELHLHGSPAVQRSVLAELAAQPGLRQAEAGEFTRRAMENGRLDLAQVEGLADLIDAETEAQRRQAMRVLSGALGDKAEGWRRDLIRAAALVEATIDFADEDVPVDVYPEVSELLGRVGNEMRREAEGVKIAERIRDGFEVAIVGAPNVGKSTLLNRLAGREAAITSEYAGTTRDVIEVRMDLGGLPVTLLDTAGLRNTEDFVEGIGIERARQRAAMADLRIYMLLPGEEPDLDLGDGDIIIGAKADIFPQARLGVSSKTGEGLDALIALVQERLEVRTQSVGIAMRERHREALVRSLGCLEAAKEQIAGGADMPDLVAEELRSAIRAVDMLVGRVDVEDLLDEIFSSFCIGK